MSIVKKRFRIIRIKTLIIFFALALTGYTLLYVGIGISSWVSSYQTHYDFSLKGRSR